ncbi:hypothetical protein H5410_057967, partial [Solanum commersonii]
MLCVKHRSLLWSDELHLLSGREDIEVNGLKFDFRFSSQGRDAKGSETGRSTLTSTFDYCGRKSYPE